MAFDLGRDRSAISGRQLFYQVLAEPFNQTLISFKPIDRTSDALTW
jgi:hypothetical protein